jgi:hypothetical protein
MSVILSKENYLSCLKPETRCFECHKGLGYPFVEWNSLFICAKCCRKIKNGLMADIVQVAAVAELHSLGYRGQTLVRMSADAAEREDREKAAGVGPPRQSTITPPAPPAP